MDAITLVVMLGGFALIGLLAWFFFGPRSSRAAQMRGHVQEIVVTVKGGYSPDVIRARKGVPLRIVFDRKEAGDCSSRVVFPDFRVSKTLAPFARTTLELTPDRAGEFGFACGMNMLHGTLIVKRMARQTGQPNHEHQRSAVGWTDPCGNGELEVDMCSRRGSPAELPTTSRPSWAMSWESMM
jgi:plastocyanin domain-containing protein